MPVFAFATADLVLDAARWLARRFRSLREAALVPVVGALLAVGALGKEAPDMLRVSRQRGSVSMVVHDPHVADFTVACVTHHLGRGRKIFCRLWMGMREKFHWLIEAPHLSLSSIAQLQGAIERREPFVAVDRIDTLRAYPEWAAIARQSQVFLLDRSAALVWTPDTAPTLDTGAALLRPAQAPRRLAPRGRTPSPSSSRAPSATPSPSRRTSAPRPRCSRRSSAVAPAAPPDPLPRPAGGRADRGGAARIRRHPLPHPPNERATPTRGVGVLAGIAAFVAAGVAHGVVAIARAPRGSPRLAPLVLVHTVAVLLTVGVAWGLVVEPALAVAQALGRPPALRRVGARRSRRWFAPDPAAAHGVVNVALALAVVVGPVFPFTLLVLHTFTRTG